MSSPKFITIFGATGNQGRSVALSLLGNKAGAFRVRAITRNPDSDGAKALAQAGAEIFKADGTARDLMVAAFAGSWGAFVNTNGDDPVSSRSSSAQYNSLLCSDRYFARRRSMSPDTPQRWISARLSWTPPRRLA